MILFSFGNRYLKHNCHKLYVYGNVMECSILINGGKAIKPPQVISYMWDHLSHARVLKQEKLVSMRIYIYIYIYIYIMRGKKDATTFPDKPVS